MVLACGVSVLPITANLVTLTGTVQYIANMFKPIIVTEIIIDLLFHAGSHGLSCKFNAKGEREFRSACHLQRL